MRLRDVAALADENIHPAVISFLRAEGFDVRTVSDARLVGATDAEVLRVATAEARFVLTHDADFGRLAIASGEPFHGIVYLRPGHIDPEFTVASLRVLVQRNPQVKRPFVIAVRRSATRVIVRVRSVP